MGDRNAKTASVTVSGMTCASCVAHVEEALKGVKGVSDARVNLATSKATVEYVPLEASLAAMREAVDEMGYEVVLDSANLMVTGMSCASCVDKIEKHTSE